MKFFLIGYDKKERQNRYFTFNTETEEWKEKFPSVSGIEPMAGNSKYFCAAFKVDQKLKIFLSGYGYNTFLLDFEIDRWQKGKY